MKGVAFMRIIAPILLFAFSIILISCSGSKIFSAPMPNISGPWEFIAVSTTSPGSSTGIEVSLQEGQVFNSATGVYDATGQVSASGTQLSFVSLSNPGSSSPNSITFGGNCTPATSDAGDNLSGSISGLAGSMNFTFTENGNLFNVTASLSADGKSMIGAYTEQQPQAGQSNGICSGSSLDQGSITGKTVSKLSGTYLGKLCQPLDSLCTAGAGDSATATLSESGTGLTVNMVLTGADNASFTLTGPVAGNFFSVQGTFGGQSVSYDGYFQDTFDKTDGLYDISTLYLAQIDFTTSPPTHTYAGTLIVPQTP